MRREKSSAYIIKFGTPDAPLFWDPGDAGLPSSGFNKKMQLAKLNHGMMNIHLCKYPDIKLN